MYCKTVNIILLYVLIQKMEHYLKQNNSVDIYEEYFSHEEPILTDEPPTARTIAVLR